MGGAVNRRLSTRVGKSATSQDVHTAESRRGRQQERACQEHEGADWQPCGIAQYIIGVDVGVVGGVDAADSAQRE